MHNFIYLKTAILNTLLTTYLTIQTVVKCLISQIIDLDIQECRMFTALTSFYIFFLSF